MGVSKPPLDENLLTTAAPSLNRAPGYPPSWSKPRPPSPGFSATIVRAYRPNVSAGGPTPPPEASPLTRPFPRGPSTCPRCSPARAHLSSSCPLSYSSLTGTHAPPLEARRPGTPGSQLNSVDHPVLPELSPSPPTGQSGTRVSRLSNSLRTKLLLLVLATVLVPDS